MRVTHTVDMGGCWRKRTEHVTFVRVGNIWEQRFGGRVKDLRQARGWTQDELAQQMTAAGYPLHQTTVAKLENGSRPTNVGEIAAFAMIFDISIAALFDPSDEDAPMHQQLMGLAYRLAGISNEKNRLKDRLAELETERVSTEVEYRDLALQINTRKQEREGKRTRLTGEWEIREGQ